MSTFYVWPRSEARPRQAKSGTENAVREWAAELAVRLNERVDVLQSIAQYEPVSYAREVDHDALAASAKQESVKCGKD